MLVTERPGRLRIVGADGQLSKPLGGLPGNIAARGQGGLLDVALSPDFAQNRLVYLSFAEDRGGGQRRHERHCAAGSTRAGRRSKASQVIFRQEPAHTGGNHFGSRLVFDRDGNLFVTRWRAVRPAGPGSEPRQPPRQGDPHHAGRTARAQQPVPDREGTRPEIWSIGHRNVQGAALNPTTGELWTAEHGARGGDEINIPRKGRNYGWPVITYGVDYSGAKIGEGTAKPGMEQPIYYWDPSIAPVRHGRSTPATSFPPGAAASWSARSRASSSRASRPTATRSSARSGCCQGLGERIRDVRQGPDGFVYLLTDAGAGSHPAARPAGLMRSAVAAAPVSLPTLP